MLGRRAPRAYRVYAEDDFLGDELDAGGLGDGEPSSTAHDASGEAESASEAGGPSFNWDEQTAGGGPVYTAPTRTLARGAAARAAGIALLATMAAALSAILAHTLLARHAPDGGSSRGALAQPATAAAGSVASRRARTEVGDRRVSVESHPAGSRLAHERARSGPAEPGGHTLVAGGERRARVARALGAARTASQRPTAAGAVNGARGTGAPVAPPADEATPAVAGASVSPEFGFER